MPEPTRPTPSPAPQSPAAPPVTPDVQTGVPDVPLLPASLDKAVAYLTDRGTLIRVGVFALGAVLTTIGVVTFFSKPTARIIKAVK